MYFAKTIFVLLLSLALAHGIAISKPTDQAEAANVPKVIGDPNNGFVVQSGYEGYIVSPQKAVSPSNNVNTVAWLLSALMKAKFLKNLLLPISGAIVLYGSKIAAIGLHLVLSLILGIVATTAVCTLTPVCSLTLSLPGVDYFRGKAIKEQVAELARNYMTSENMEIATELLQSALSKYGTSQRRESEQPDELQDRESAAAADN